MGTFPCKLSNQAVESPAGMRVGNKTRGLDQKPPPLGGFLLAVIGENMRLAADYELEVCKK